MVKKALSLHAKILLLCFLLTATVVISSVFVFVNYDHNQFQHIQSVTSNVVKNASAMASAIANNDKPQAQNYLNQLKLNPDIASADAYLLRGGELEQYFKDSPESPQLATSTDTLLNKQLEYVFPIYNKNNVYGGIYIKSTNISNTVLNFIELVILLLLITFFIAMYIEDVLMKPFNLLVNAINEITIKNNYSFRLSNSSADEVGSLISAFNAMLEKIESDEKMDRQSKEQIRHLAYYDMLTGLPNLDLFQELISRQLHDADKNQQNLWLLIVCVNDYKVVNANYGHTQANEILKDVSGRISHYLEANPEIKTQYLLARYNTDHFILSFNNLQNTDHVDTILNELRKQVGKTSLSIGIASFPKDGENYQELLQKATLALSQGKGLQTYYEAGLHKLNTQKLQLEQELHDALAEHQLILSYQPKYRFDCNQIVGFEALLRWHHPKHGVISPDDFISMAEQTGLIIPIGHWVIEQACKQCKLLHDQGHKNVHISVNLSPKQFDDTNLLNQIKQTLKQIGLPPQHFELELTESIILLNDAKTVEMLGGLKQIGIRLAIDDFGTGYSSLRYLTQYPLDAIKIDKCFIKYITENASDATITKAIIGLAKDLQLNVIAEGIETAEQFEYLKQQGCSEIQGYYIAQPLRDYELSSFLSKRNVYARNT